MPISIGKSKSLLNGPRWVVFRRSSLYYSEWLFGRSQGSRNQRKSKRNACENRVRKRHAELNKNGTSIRSQKSSTFQKYRKKGIPKTIRKQSAERNIQTPDLVSNPGCRVACFEPVGGRGVQCKFKFRIQRGCAPGSLKSLASGGCGVCFFIQTGVMGLAGSTYSQIFDILVRC